MAGIRVGKPWSNEPTAIRESIQKTRALTIDERVSRPSVAQWYAGRNVFVTGASGFLGRVLVEFLLRCCPDIGKVYVVLRPKRGMPVHERLPAMLDVPLFDRLRAEQPDALSKVVALSGDVEQLSLGLSEDDRRLICAEVSVVFHVAASVRFDDPIRKAVFTNLRSSREVVTLAKNMPQLKALVHVSTAYCNTDKATIEEKVYATRYDWRETLRWAEELTENDATAMDFLGTKVRGLQPNTYTFTKAMAERLMEDAAEDLPIIITRPSIVVGSFKDPIPGWIDNLNGLCGFLAGCFSGVLRVTRGPNFFFDSQPVDVATKLMVLASWTRGLGIDLNKPDDVDVVNVTIGNSMGVTYEDFSHIVSEEGFSSQFVFPNAVRTGNFQYYNCPFTYAVMHFYHHIIFGFLVDLLARATGQRPRLMGIYRTMVAGLHATAPFRRTVPLSFPMENQYKLQKMMHPDDEKNLDFTHIYHYRDNMETFRTAIAENIRGVLLYVLKLEDDQNENRKRGIRLRWLERAYHSVMALLAFGLIFGIYNLLRR